MDRQLTICESDGIPESLRIVIESIDQTFNGANRSQQFAGILYVLMQESGFVLAQSTEGLEEPPSDNNTATAGGEKRTMSFNIKRVLSQARLVSPLLHAGPYKLTFRLVGVDDYQFNLIMTPVTNELMIINLLIKKEDFRQVHTIALKLTDYIPRPDDKNISNRYSCLPELSKLFKDSIAHKGRSAVLNEEGVVNNSLVGLLYEIQQKIAVNLSRKDFYHLSVTCQSLHALINDNCMWKVFLLRDFFYKANEEEMNDETKTLKDMYKEFQMFKNRSNIQRLEENMSQQEFDFDDSDFDGTSLMSLPQSRFDVDPYYIIKNNLPNLRSQYRNRFLNS